MKKIYRLKHEERLNDLDPRVTYGPYQYGELPDAQDYNVVTKFDVLPHFIAKNNPENIYTEKRWYSKTPVIYYDITWSPTKITKKNFKSYVISNSYVEESLSFEAVKHCLKAEDFLEWLKDHGLINTSKLNKMDKK